MDEQAAGQTHPIDEVEQILASDTELSPGEVETLARARAEAARRAERCTIAAGALREAAQMLTDAANIEAGCAQREIDLVRRIAQRLSA